MEPTWVIMVMSWGLVGTHFVPIWACRPLIFAGHFTGQSKNFIFLVLEKYLGMGKNLSICPPKNREKYVKCVSHSVLFISEGILFLAIFLKNFPLIRFN